MLCAGRDEILEDDEQVVLTEDFSRRNHVGDYRWDQINENDVTYVPLLTSLLSHSFFPAHHAARGGSNENPIIVIPHQAQYREA